MSAGPPEGAGAETRTAGRRLGEALFEPERGRDVVALAAAATAKPYPAREAASIEASPPPHAKSRVPDECGLEGSGTVPRRARETRYRVRRPGTHTPAGSQKEYLAGLEPPVVLSPDLHRLGAVDCRPAGGRGRAPKAANRRRERRGASLRHRTRRPPPKQGSRPAPLASSRLAPMDHPAGSHRCCRQWIDATHETPWNGVFVATAAVRTAHAGSLEGRAVG